MGQFDKYANVDVYAVMMTKREKVVAKITKDKKVKSANINHAQTINDLFDVCVGPVVDNRDVKEGPLLPYIVSRGLQGWSVQTDIPLTRQHQGKSFESPFVVIKRTSRMGDISRAVATIINIPTPVYVDNHLIILKPKSGEISDCQKALTELKSSRTHNWLNEEIRCRHLTVKVVSAIPILRQ